MTSGGAQWGKHGGGGGSVMVAILCFSGVVMLFFLGEEGKNKVGPKKMQCSLELIAWTWTEVSDT